MKKLLRLLFVLFFLPFTIGAQVQLNTANPEILLDFSNSMPSSVGSTPPTAFAGYGFAPDATAAGRLNSNAWEVMGLNFGELHFGDTQTVDAFGRGSTVWGVVTPGIYAFVEQPGSVQNPSLLIQPGDLDFTPGHITLRIQNTASSNMTSLAINYDVLFRNDGENSVHFDFSHSLNNTTFTTVPGMRYTTPADSDEFGYNYVGLTPTHEYTITGLNVSAGEYIYLRWSVSDAGGTGDYDEIGLDNINLRAGFGTAKPLLEVATGTNVILENYDDVPTVTKSTLISTSSSPTSTINSSASIPIYIKNKGTANLNISGITITGANPADFTIFTSNGELPTGTVTPVGTANSTKTIYIKFAPTAAGYRSARITINSNDATASPFWFDVAGHGRVAQPDITVRSLTGILNITSGSMVASNPNGCLWGTIDGGNYADKTFRIANDGHIGVQLLLTGTPVVRIEGANPQDFTVTVQPAMTALHAGFVSMFTIRFSPTGSGIRTAIVHIENNDVVPDPATGAIENPFTFLIQGTGRTSDIDVLGNAIPIPSGSTAIEVVNNTDYDAVRIGESTTRTYTIANLGQVPLTISGLTLTGDAASDFQVISQPAATVAANATTTFTVQFTPTVVGERLATVQIASNDPDENPYLFNVQGNGADFSPCQMTDVASIGNQLFEIAPTAPNWTYTGGTLGSGTGHGSVNDNGTSNRFIGARSLLVSNATANVVMASMNTSTYDYLTFTMRLAAFGTTANEGMGNGDAVHIEVSTNNGTTYQRALTIRGGSSSKWSFVSGTGILNVPFQAGSPATVITAGNDYATTDGYSAIRLTQIPNSTNMRIRITATSTSGNRFWALDEFRLFARQYERTVWNGSTWSNGVPTVAKKAVFTGNYTTTSAGISACECEISTGATVTVNDGHTFQVESHLKIVGNLVFENNASLVQRDNFAVNTGSIVYKRNTTPVRKFDFTYWSSPVEEQVLNVLSPLTLFDKFFSFNSVANNWQLEPGTAQMEVGRGYIIRSPNNFSTTVPAVFNAQFTGKPNNGIVHFGVTGATGNYQLIGNPYPSAIDANAFITYPGNSDAINGTLYFWTHSTPLTNFNYTSSDYATYNLLGGTGTTSTAAGANNTVPNGFVSAGQSFMTLSRAPGNVTFANSMRVGSNNTQFFRQSESTTSGTIAPSRVWLGMENALGEYKEILVGYSPLATLDLDYGLDGEVAESNAEMQFYSVGAGTPLSIQGRPIFDSSDRVELGVGGLTSTPYQIKLDRADGVLSTHPVYLEDAALGIVHDLRLAPYAFQLLGDDHSGRFYLRYTASTLGNSDWQAGHEVAVIRTAAGMAIKAYQAINSVRLYNLQGQLIGTYSVNATEASLDLAHLANQVLIVQFTFENEAIVNKKFSW